MSKKITVLLLLTMLVVVLVSSGCRRGVRPQRVGRQPAQPSSQLTKRLHPAAMMNKAEQNRREREETEERRSRFRVAPRSFRIAPRSVNP